MLKMVLCKMLDLLPPPPKKLVKDVSFLSVMFSVHEKGGKSEFQGKGGVAIAFPQNV